MRACLTENAVAGVIDYGQVMHCLSAYKAPHRKITTMLKNQDLIRVKKGLYVLGDRYRVEPYSTELLANLIFGPSYISQEYALQHYGLIPERVELVTSMTTKRQKDFQTPVGNFKYSYLNHSRFTVGVDLTPISNKVTIFIASPEKAIADTVFRYRDIASIQDMQELLIEDLRIDTADISNLSLERMSKISDTYRNPTVSLLFQTLKRGL